MTKSLVTRTPTPTSETTLEHFSKKLQFETDCWDVHHAFTNDAMDFVLLDVRAPELYSAGHVPGARNIRLPQLQPATLAEFPDDTLFVVYCAGPHCNGATKAAIQLARLGRPVKEMIGGVEGWKDEGFSLEVPGLT